MSTSSPSSMTGEPIRILLVEDDQAHAEIVRRNLAEARVANAITHLEDGQAALDYLQGQGAWAPPARAPRPHLILLDLRLPKVDGLEVLARIEAEPQLVLIPTVILTTSNAESDVVRAYENGASSYLVKPVDFDKFNALLRSFGFFWLAWNRFPEASDMTGHEPAR